MHSPTDIEQMLDAIADAEQALSGTTDRVLTCAEELLDRYRALVDALRPRPVETEIGPAAAVGLTVAGLDIHVTDTGNDLIVHINADNRPDGRTAYVEDWAGVVWHQPLH